MVESMKGGGKVQVGSNGYSHPGILEHVGDVIEGFGVRKIIGQAMTIDGDIDRTDRRPRGNVGGEGVTSGVSRFICCIIPSRMDDDGSQRERRRGRRLRNGRVGSEHKANLFVGRGKMDNGGGRGVRVTSRDDMHSRVLRGEVGEMSFGL